MTSRRPHEVVTDAERGLFQGTVVARVFRSSDGMFVLVGKSDRDNDTLTFRLAAGRDFWLHLASGSGSHVVVLNPGNLPRLPRATEELAAGLAVGYSKGRQGGRAAVHLARCSEVSKPRGLPAGKVVLSRFRTVHARPLRDDPRAGGATTDC